MIESYFEDGNQDFDKTFLNTLENNFYDPNSSMAGKIEVHNLMCDLVRSEAEFDEVHSMSNESVEEEGLSQ